GFATQWHACGSVSRGMGGNECVAASARVPAAWADSFPTPSDTPSQPETIASPSAAKPLSLQSPNQWPEAGLAKNPANQYQLIPGEVSASSSAAAFSQLSPEQQTHASQATSVQVGPPGPETSGQAPGRSLPAPGVDAEAHCRGKRRTS